MIWSMHDREGDAMGNLYFPAELYKCFGARKARFVKAAVEQGANSKVVLLSHINLLMIGWMIKKMSPKTKVILMAHGIEIWSHISGAKSLMLPVVDEFWAVSNYTARRIQESHRLPAARISVLNNCLDPFLPMAKNIEVPVSLQERYGLQPADRMLFTLTRLSSKEKYKGYEHVISALQQLNDPTIKYVLAGKADREELKLVQQKVMDAGLEKQVILAGYIPDQELAAHFKMSDCYIMPSSKEGFGIVFIEAMYYGVPVIGGNADGTMDALRNGQLGTAVEPGNVDSIKAAIQKVLSHLSDHIPDHELLMNHFSYSRYKEKLQDLLA